MLQGAFTALVTPFETEDINKVNYKKLKELIEFQINKKIDGLVICGTTGESATLSDAEKRRLIKTSIKIVNKRIPVIAGTGSNNTKHSIELSKYAKNVGADYLLLITPYYNKTSQEGLYEHFKTIAEAVDLPIIIYNVPSRTGIDISVDTIVRLSKIDNIIGIKEASCDISKIAHICKNKPKDFCVLSGNDDMVVPFMSLGASGVISVLSNIYPYEVKSMCSSALKKDFSYAKDIQLRFLDLIKLLFIEPNPIPIKDIMNLLYFDVGQVRLPLYKANDSTHEALKTEIFKVPYKNRPSII